MKIQTQKYNHITVITLQGELDADSTSQVKDTLLNVLRPPSDELTKKPNSTVTFQSGVVFDMNNVSFIDSAGLEFLLWARDHCNENNCQMRLAGLDESCTKIIEITRLENEFAYYGELAEAVKSVV
jgi:anti-anti-sigma factor